MGITQPGVRGGLRAQRGGPPASERINSSGDDVREAPRAAPAQPSRSGPSSPLAAACRGAVPATEACPSAAECPRTRPGRSPRKIVTSSGRLRAEAMPVPATLVPIISPESLSSSLQKYPRAERSLPHRHRRHRHRELDLLPPPQHDGGLHRAARPGDAPALPVPPRLALPRPRRRDLAPLPPRPRHPRRPRQRRRLPGPEGRAARPHPRRAAARRLLLRRPRGDGRRGHGGRRGRPRRRDPRASSGPRCLVSTGPGPARQRLGAAGGAGGRLYGAPPGPHDDAPLTTRAGLRAPRWPASTRRPARCAPGRASPPSSPASAPARWSSRARRVYARLAESDGVAGVLDASLWVGYVWADEPAQRGQRRRHRHRAPARSRPRRATIAAASGTPATPSTSWPPRAPPTGASTARRARRRGRAGHLHQQLGDNPTAGGVGDVPYFLGRLLAHPHFGAGAGTRDLRQHPRPGRGRSVPPRRPRPGRPPLPGRQARPAARPAP